METQVGKKIKKKVFKLYKDADRFWMLITILNCHIKAAKLKIMETQNILDYRLFKLITSNTLFEVYSHSKRL